MMKRKIIFSHSRTRGLRSGGLLWNNFEQLHRWGHELHRWVPGSTEKHQPNGRSKNSRGEVQTSCSCISENGVVSTVKSASTFLGSHWHGGHIPSYFYPKLIHITTALNQHVAFSLPRLDMWSFAMLPKWMPDISGAPGSPTNAGGVSWGLFGAKVRLHLCSLFMPFCYTDTS